MARTDDDTHEVYRTAQNTPSGSRSSREHDTSMIAIMDHEQRHSSDGDIQRVYYGHGALIVNLVLQVIIVCVLEGLQIQHTMTGMSKDCIMTLDVIEISQVGLVYRGLVVAATLYQLLFCLDTIQQQSGIHLAMLLVNGLLFIVFMGIQITQNTKWETTMQEMGCKATSLSYPHYDHALLAVVGFLYLALVGCSVWMRQMFTTKTKAKAMMVSTTLMAFIKLDIYYLYCYSVQLVPAMILDHANMYPVELVLVPVLGTLILSLTWYSALNNKPWLLVILALLICLSLGYFGYRTALFAHPYPVHSDPYYITRTSLLFVTLTLLGLLLLSMGIMLLYARCLLRGKTLFLRYR